LAKKTTMQNNLNTKRKELKKIGKIDYKTSEYRIGY
jgi:hypothetical protein